MNIFATFDDPVRAARWLDDQRLIKLMLESTQMMATAAHSVDLWKEGMPKPSHVNHPCNKWVRERRGNFDWMLEHTLALEAEWQRRFDHQRRHKTLEIFCRLGGKEVRRSLPKGRTEFANCAANSTLGISFHHVTDVRKAYRMYLRARWRLQQGTSRLAICSVRPKD